MCSPWAQALTSHAKGKKHQSVTNVVAAHGRGFETYFDQEAQSSSISESMTSTSQSTASIRHSETTGGSVTLNINTTDQLTAETMWALNMIHNGYTFSSNLDNSFVFKTMFPDSYITHTFSMAETKSIYTITYGVAPYVQSMLEKRIKESREYVLLFDETLNKDFQKKQVDLLARIWDIDEISSRYLTSVFIGHGAAVDLENVMSLHVKNKLGYGNIIQLSMDGPNVNWALFDRLQETLDAEYDHKLKNIGSCGLHTLHNSFRDGAQSTDWGIGGILDVLHRLFKDVPGRREDYINATSNNDSQFPLKFGQQRWVENVIVANRDMEIRENIE